MYLKSISSIALLLIINVSTLRGNQWFHDSESYIHSNRSSSENHQNLDKINVNSTELSQNQSQSESEGRSAKSLDFDQLYQSNNDGDREPRIINDKELSIKGFIPIVGFGNDKHDSERQPSKQNENLDIQSFVDQTAHSQYNPNSYSQSFANQKHIPRPEDQRFIGAALQGLTASLTGNKPSRKQGYGYEAYNGFNSLNSNLGCTCVPFYMCKNGYLTEAKNSGPKSPNIQTAQSILKQFAIPAPHSFGQKHPSHQNPFEEFLPIDERSNDDLILDSSQQIYTQSQNNSAPQYADEVLARMLGVRSDGCGVLRTCCKQHPVTGNNFPDFQMPFNYPNGGSIQDSNEFNKRFTNQFQPIVQQIPGYDKPERPHKYESPYSQRPFEAFPSQVVQSSYGFAPKPLSPIRDLNDYPTRPFRPQIPVPLRPELPSIEPLRPNPSYQSFKPELSLHSFENNGNPDNYGVCGRRHAVGIHGRVQNLQYHESSTEFGEFPWQVAILKRLGPADSLYVCGGALISPVFIVTAAHCLKKFHPKDLKVRLGEWDVHREDEFYPYVEKYIEDIIVHPDFFPGNLLNDIALIKLESPVEVNNSPHIAPICLPEAYEIFAGQRCFVSGWGKNSFGHQGEFQSVLTKVDVPVLSHGECEHALKRTRLGHNYHLHPSMVCAGGEPGKDACEGDGGSGLVCDVRGVWKVIGLVSWGVGCGKPGVPGVYTNMAHMKPWIDSHIHRFGGGFVPPVDNFESGYGVISERSSAKSDNNSHNNTHIEEQQTKEDSDVSTNTTQSSL